MVRGKIGIFVTLGLVVVILGGLLIKDVVQRHHLMKEGERIATRAQHWYKRPSMLEGGGCSFKEFSLGTIGTTDSPYSVSQKTVDSFVLTGTKGRVSVSITVYADTTVTSISEGIEG